MNSAREVYDLASHENLEGFRSPDALNSQPLTERSSKFKKSSKSKKKRRPMTTKKPKREKLVTL